MPVRATRLWRALHGVGGVDRDRVLVDVILVHVVQMPVVQIIDVASMAHRRVAAVGPMLVRVVGMMLLSAGGHGVFPSLLCQRDRVLLFGTVLHGDFHANAERDCRKANSRYALPRDEPRALRRAETMVKPGRIAKRAEPRRGVFQLRALRQPRLGAGGHAIMPTNIGMIPARAIPEISYIRSHDPALRAGRKCSLELDAVTL
jgi:hypothetical protein